MGHLLQNGIACPSLRLLIVFFSQIRRSRGQVPEQSTRTLCNSGEIHLCCRRSCRIIIVGAEISRTDSPDAIYRERFSTGILKQTVNFAGSDVISCDKAAGFSVTTTCKLSDKQVMPEAPEIKGSQRYTPRSVQPGEPCSRRRSS